MNRKNDYVQMLSELDAYQYRLYDICSTNFRYFSNLIYNNITMSDDVNIEIVSQREHFIEWLNDNLTNDDCITRLDSEVINWIHDYPEFFDFYKGDWSVDSIINSVIQSWKNKPKTRRLNKLGMLYANYVRFLGTGHGQTFKYGTTAFDLIQANSYPVEGLPFYKEKEYQYQELAKLKKIVVLEVAKTGLEACEAMALWDATFNFEKFSYSNAINLVKNDPKLGKLSEGQIRRHLLTMHIKLLKAILKGDRVETYFNTEDTLVEMNNTIYSLRNILEYYLSNAEKEANKDKPKVLADISKIVNGHVNVKAYTKDEIRIIIQNFCTAKGIPCSFTTGYYHGIAKLKIDSDFGKHKTYKLWIYDGGGYKDFSLDKTGYITDLIPMEYFSKI